MDEEGENPTDVTMYALKEANALVEEFMLLANITGMAGEGAWGAGKIGACAIFEIFSCYLNFAYSACFARTRSVEEDSKTLPDVGCSPSAPTALQARNGWDLWLEMGGTCGSKWVVTWNCDGPPSTHIVSLRADVTTLPELNLRRSCRLPGRSA